MKRVFEWMKTAPESQGMNEEKLDAMWKELKKRRTKALLIVRNDKIVYEKYAEGWHKKKKTLYSFISQGFGRRTLLNACDRG